MFPLYSRQWMCKDYFLVLLIAATFANSLKSLAVGAGWTCKGTSVAWDAVSSRMTQNYVKKKKSLQGKRLYCGGRHHVGVAKLSSHPKRIGWSILHQMWMTTACEHRSWLPHNNTFHCRNCYVNVFWHRTKWSHKSNTLQKPGWVGKLQWSWANFFVGSRHYLKTSWDLWMGGS